jgi:hypothetical protein
VIKRGAGDWVVRCCCEGIGRSVTMSGLGLAVWRRTSTTVLGVLSTNSGGSMVIWANWNCSSCNWLKGHQARVLGMIDDESCCICHFGCDCK